MMGNALITIALLQLAGAQSKGQRDETEQQTLAHQPVTLRSSSENRASVAATARQPAK